MTYNFRIDPLSKLVEDWWGLWTRPQEGLPEGVDAVAGGHFPHLNGKLDDRVRVWDRRVYYM